MSLLSIPLFEKNIISVLLIAGKAVFIDLQEDFYILGYQTQEADVLSYVEDYQQGALKVSRNR